jgi:hypothetical protein
MVPNITAILQRLTGEWAALLQPEAILAACGEVGYTGWRDRVLTPATTVASEPRCSDAPSKSGCRVIVPSSSIALGARCPILLPSRTRSANRRSSGRGAAFPWHTSRRRFLHATAAGVLTAAVAPARLTGNRQEILAAAAPVVQHPPRSTTSPPVAAGVAEPGQHGQWPNLRALGRLGIHWSRRVWRR